MNGLNPFEVRDSRTGELYVQASTTWPPRESELIYAEYDGQGRWFWVDRVTHLFGDGRSPTLIAWVLPEASPEFSGLAAVLKSRKAGGS